MVAQGIENVDILLFGSFGFNLFSIVFMKDLHKAFADVFGICGGSISLLHESPSLCVKYSMVSSNREEKS